MSGLTPREREMIACTIGDVFMPYGREFNAEDGARLLEARVETLLGERESAARAQAVEDSRVIHRGILAQAKREAAADLRQRIAALAQEYRETALAGGLTEPTDHALLGVSQRLTDLLGGSDGE